MVRMTASWYTECPIIFFIIVLDISGLVRPYGLRLSNSSLGNSVANANDAKVSIIRFTQSICIAFNGESCQTNTNNAHKLVLLIWCFIKIAFCRPICYNFLLFLLLLHCHRHFCHHQSLLFFTPDLKHTSSLSLFHSRLNHRYSLDWFHGLPARPRGRLSIHL